MVVASEAILNHEMNLEKKPSMTQWHDKKTLVPNPVQCLIYFKSEWFSSLLLISFIPHFLVSHFLLEHSLILWSHNFGVSAVAKLSSNCYYR